MDVVSNPDKRSSAFESLENNDFGQFGEDTKLALWCEFWNGADGTLEDDDNWSTRNVLPIENIISYVEERVEFTGVYAEFQARAFATCQWLDITGYSQWPIIHGKC